MIDTIMRILGGFMIFFLGVLFGVILIACLMADRRDE